MCTKFNTIQEIYDIQNFPFGDGENADLISMKQAAQYWIDASVRKANCIVTLLDDPHMAHPLLHDKIIILMQNAFNKMHKYFKTTIWQFDM